MNTAELTIMLERFAFSEAQVITWGLAILAAGLAVSFLPIPRNMRAMLTALALLALSALEILFLWTTKGFTFYLPSVAGGWMRAALYFACFALFLTAQIYLFLKTLAFIEYGIHVFAGGANLIAVICAVMFFALYFLASILSELLWRPLVVPFAWTADHFLYVYIAAQAVLAIYLFREAESKRKAVFAVIPVHFAAISAIWMMVIDMIPAMFIAAIAFLLLASSVIEPTPEQIAAARAAQAESDRQHAIKAREEELREMARHNKPIL